jgi:hypothetical protein
LEVLVLLSGERWAPPLMEPLEGEFCGLAGLALGLLDGDEAPPLEGDAAPLRCGVLLLDGDDIDPPLEGPDIEPPLEGADMPPPLAPPPP